MKRFDVSGNLAAAFSFFLLAIVWFTTGKTSLGAVFLALGAVFLAIDQQKNDPTD